jgi:hypothetical protein
LNSDDWQICRKYSRRRLFLIDIHRANVVSTILSYGARVRLHSPEAVTIDQP